MELVLANNQGELNPLEQGMHAEQATDKGKWGKSVNSYAKAIGRPQGTVKHWVCAARVAKVSRQRLTLLGDKTQQLEAIHSLPEAIWPDACQSMLKEGWSAKDTAGGRVKVERSFHSRTSSTRPWHGWRTTNSAGAT